MRNFNDHAAFQSHLPVMKKPRNQVSKVHPKGQISTTSTPSNSGSTQKKSKTQKTTSNTKSQKLVATSTKGVALVCFPKKHLF